MGGSRNIGKERYLSKTPFVTFIHLSKCNIKLPGIFGNVTQQVQKICSGVFPRQQSLCFNNKDAFKETTEKELDNAHAKRENH